MNEEAIAKLIPAEVTVALGQRAFNKVLPDTAFSSNGELLPRDYIRDYETYPLGFEGKRLSYLLGVGWLALVSYVQGDCIELTSPLSRS
ncbi:MAG: hypothetical protein R3B54_13640 [Bdellovibrionota bacterium]